MSGPGSSEQNNYGNPASFFNGPQQTDGGQDFFDQHHQGGPQQPNWYPQHHPSVDMPINPQPQSSASMFYDPTEYAKGVVSEQPVINSFPQTGANQQQQQPDMNQQFSDDKYPNSGNPWYHQDNIADPPHSQDVNHTQQNQSHYREVNMHGQMVIHENVAESYDQQPPYYSQQSNELLGSGHALHENGDNVPPNPSEQPPTTRESEVGWNNQTPANQLQNNGSLDNGSNVSGNSNQAPQTASLGQLVTEDEDSGSGYLRFFHNDDNESDFVESDKTESAEDSSPLEIPPRTNDGHEGLIFPNVPSSVTDGTITSSQLPAVKPKQLTISQPFLPGQEFVKPSNQGEISETFYNPSNSQPSGGVGSSAVKQVVGPCDGSDTGQATTETDQSQTTNGASNVGPPSEPHLSHTNNGASNVGPPSEPHLSQTTNGASNVGPPSEPHLSQTTNGTSNVGPPSEPHLIIESLPPSEPPGSLSASRSNSLFGEAGGSLVPSTNGNHKNVQIDTTKEIGIQEQFTSNASLERNLPHKQISNSVNASSTQLSGSVPGQAQNVQMLPVSLQPLYFQGGFPPPDISMQNTTMSVISNISVPSTAETDVSRTGSLNAESEQQFRISQSNPNKPTGTGSGVTFIQPPSSTQSQDNLELKQDIPHMPSGTRDIPPLDINKLAGHNNMQQSIQSSGLDPNGLPLPGANPNQPKLPSPGNISSQTSSLSVNAKLSTPPVHTHMQSAPPTNSLLEPNPLLSGASHPSAFRTVRGHHGQVPISADVNPSPPLWSTEVPPLPSNIILAPALAAPSNRALTVTTPSQSTEPIKLDSNLAANIANVSVPPPPTLVGQNSGIRPMVQGPTVPSSGGQNASNVAQVTQNMSGLTMEHVSQPTLLPLTGVLMPLAQPSITVPTTGHASQVHVQAVQSHLSPGQSMMQEQLSVDASSSAPSISNQSSPVKTVQPVPMLAGVPHQPQHAPPVTSVAQDSYQYHLGQPHAPYQQQQLPAGQGQWYTNSGQQYPYSQQPYPQQDYRYQYDPYYRQYQKQGSSYYKDQQRTYSKQGYEQQRAATKQGYEQQRAAYRDRDPTRSYSRQGYEEDRPRSRQGRDHEYDVHYKHGYSRRDPRQKDYANQEEFSQRQGYRGYDQRYREWYRNNERYQQQQVNKSRGYDQNSSALDQSKNDPSQSHKGNQPATDLTDGKQESFASQFHHTGGSTPDKYGVDQSSIAAPDCGDYSDQYGNKGNKYGDWYDRRGSYDNWYGHNTSGSWNQHYQYGNGTDLSYAQQQAKPATPPPPERLTPALFNRPHVTARFSSGGHLVKVMPNSPVDGQPATVEIHSIELMLEHRDEYNKLKAFPGPLVRNDTHKNDVVRFALQKAIDCRKSTDITDKESAALLWDLMVLLCRQNGTIVGTDISELLLHNHPMTNTLPAATHPPLSVAATEEEADTMKTQEEDEGAQATKEVPALHPAKKTGPDIDTETHRFREMLLFGRKKEALESAVKGGLWGHALLLACKMDHRTHLSVMTRFANSLPMNDPLQTLYQLMSNRQPAAVTSCTDEKWGDWRPHLAMIISNLVSNTDLDVKSITTLGDSLASRSLLHASHFCYLMAQIGLGHYSKRTTKMVLLGVSHSLPFSEFARVTPIQQTEVYEYAQSLNNKRYSLPTFHVYKLIYATYLLDYGLITQALHYCEVIANAIQNLPAYYSPTLVDQVSELSHRLKYHDPQYFDGREVIDPDWLKDLDHIKIQFEEGAIRPSSTTDTPMPWVESSSNLSTMGDSETSEGLTFDVGRSNAPERGQPQRVDTPLSDYGRGSPSPMQGHQQQPYEASKQSQDQGYGDSQHMQDQMQVGAAGTFTLDPSGYYQPASEGNSDYPGVQKQVTAGYDWGMQQLVGGNYTQFGTQPSESTNPPNLDLAASAGSNFSEYSTTSPTTNESGTDTDLANSGASQEFDYYGMSTKMKNTYPGMGTNDQPTGPPSSISTMTPPDTPINRTRTRTVSGNSNQITPMLRKAEPLKLEKPKDKKEKAKPKQKGGWFKGWFGGNKEMHLPDDKDKTIQWDEDNQRWVNTDEDDVNDGGTPPPPPTDHELSGGHAPTSSGVAGPPGGGGPAAGPPPGVNKFSRKLGRGNYVDIFNQGSTMPAKSNSMPPPSKIFDTMPVNNAMPMNFFIPQAGSDPVDDSGTQQSNVGNPDTHSQTPFSQQHSGHNSGAQTQANEPQSFAPNSFSGNTTGDSNLPGMDSGGHQKQIGHQPPPNQQQMHQIQQQEDNLSRTSSMSSLSQEVSQHMNNQQQDGQSVRQQEEAPGTAAPAPPPVTQPVMFNPQQFPQPNYPTPQQTPRRGRGYGSRRQYPNQR